MHNNDLLDDRSEEEIAADKARENYFQDLQRDALRYLLNSRNGRRFLWNLLGKTGFARNAFALDPHSTAYNNGRQSIGTDLIVDMDMIDPYAYSTMIKEAVEDKQVYDRSSSNSGSTGGSSDSSTSGSSATSGSNSIATITGRPE